MRWIWIDRILELQPRERLVAIKHVSLVEEHLDEHFPGDDALGLDPCPIMPAPLIIEGMAQTAGILVGHASQFREKVILAKISRAEFSREAVPGDTLRYTATIRRLDEAGAVTAGEVEIIAPDTLSPTTIGRIDLMFSHIDKNLAGVEFPEHNFVFSESFRTLLRSSGFDPGF